MANNNNVELIGILGDDMKVNQTKYNKMYKQKIF